MYSEFWAYTLVFRPQFSRIRLGSEKCPGDSTYFLTSCWQQPDCCSESAFYLLGQSWFVEHWRPCSSFRCKSRISCCKSIQNITPTLAFCLLTSRSSLPPPADVGQTHWFWIARLACKITLVLRVAGSVCYSTAWILRYIMRNAAWIVQTGRLNNGSKLARPFLQQWNIYQLIIFLLYSVQW